MTDHAWVKREVDGGPAGTDEFWHCTECGASGGVTTHVEWPGGKWGEGKGTIVDRNPKPFYPGVGLDLSEDCNEAKSQILRWIGKANSAIILLENLRKQTGAEDILAHVEHLQKRAVDQGCDGGDEE